MTRVRWTPNANLSLVLLAVLALSVLVHCAEDYSRVTNRNFKKFKNCSTIDPPSTLDSPPPRYGFGCDTVDIQYATPEIYQNRRGRVEIVYQAFSIPFSVCSFYFDQYVMYNITGISVDNCWTYYCENEFPFDGTNPWWYLDGFNYCMYCNDAPAREEFWYSIENGTCHGINSIMDPSRMYTHCNRRSWKEESRDILSDGVPLLDTYVSEIVGKESYFCYCPKWNRFGFKCDGNTAFLDPYDYFAEPVIIVVSFFALFVVNILICSVPLASKVIKIWRNAATSADAYKETPLQRITVHVLTSLSITFQVLAFIISFFFPFYGGDAYIFFAAVYDAFQVIVEGFLFAALFTYVSIWINLLHKANAPNPDDPVPWYLKILPVPIYVLTLVEVIVIIIVNFTFSYSSGNITRNAWLYTNTTVYLVWIGCMIVAWSVMAVYGVRLYRMLSKVQNVNPINLKFTRLIIAFTFIGIAYIIFRVYISATNLAKYITVTFFIRVRHTILAIILFSFCAVLMATVYDPDELREAYPCLAPFIDKISPNKE